MIDPEDLHTASPSPVWRLSVETEPDTTPRLVARLSIDEPARFEIRFEGLELRSAHGPRPALVWRAGTPLSFESVRMHRLSPQAAMTALAALQQRLADGPDVPLNPRPPGPDRDEPRVRHPSPRRLRARR